MNENIIHYKGYPARVEFSAEDGCLVGRVLGIRDIIGFHGDTIAQAEEDFRGAIDFYLASCKKRGKKPNTPKYEALPLAIPADVYSRIALIAEDSGQTVAEIVVHTLQESYPEGKKSKTDKAVMSSGRGKGKRRVPAK